MRRKLFEQDFSRHLNALRALAFVRGIDVDFERRHTGDCGIDAEIWIKTTRRTFKLAAEFKRSYLDRVTVNGLIAQQMYLRDRQKIPVLLVARYIPAPSAERLVQAGINFVDSVGNLYLNLGSDYHALVIGRKEPKPKPTERRTTAAMVQVTLAFLVDHTAAKWTVRKVAEVAGVSKTAAAEAHQRLRQRGMLVTSSTGFKIDRKALEEDFLTGYAHVLRSSLLMGTFRPTEHDSAVLLRTFNNWASRNKVVWAATGGLAAFALERLPRDERITIFLASRPEELQPELKLSPDRNGSVSLLRSFGTLFPWRLLHGMPVAHPLLIYAELLHEGGPRAIEAAAQIRARHLE